MSLKSMHVKLCKEAHAALAAMAKAHNKTLGGMAADLTEQSIFGMARHYKPVEDTQTRSGFVYVIRCGNRYKIGKANDVDKRLRNMQLPSAPEVIEQHFCEDALGVEKKLHGMFKHARERGEWFRLNVSELSQLRSALTASQL